MRKVEDICHAAERQTAIYDITRLVPRGGSETTPFMAETNRTRINHEVQNCPVGAPSAQRHSAGR